MRLAAISEDVLGDAMTLAWQNAVAKSVTQLPLLGFDLEHRSAATMDAHEKHVVWYEHPRLGIAMTSPLKAFADETINRRKPGALHHLAFRVDSRADVEANADLVFLAGYMRRVGPKVLAVFRGRIINTHPALLPEFGGKGMYGDRVFDAVLQAHENESGVSVHLVDREYDSGAVVAQCRVPVRPDDSLDTLKARVQAREKEFVVETLAKIASGAIALDR